MVIQIKKEETKEEEIVLPIRQPSNPFDRPAPRPITKRLQVTSQTYDPYGDGGMTTQSGRFKS